MVRLLRLRHARADDRAAFFPAGNATLSLLLTWAGFAIGFGFRPLGAILFGFIGDKLGRKYTFLVTVTLMGAATAAVGMVPSEASIGIAAPFIVSSFASCRVSRSAVSTAARRSTSPSTRRRDGAAIFTGFIQASVIGGFVLSLAVVLVTRLSLPPEDFAAWGWRLPFLISIVLLAISLWMRLKLSESPVFKAMKEEGKTSRNPFVESFTYPGNKKRIFVALMGVACGLTIIFYTALFSTLSFLKGPMRVDDTAAELIVGISSLLAVPFFVYFGGCRTGSGARSRSCGAMRYASCCCSRCSGASPSSPIRSSPTPRARRAGGGGGAGLRLQPVRVGAGQPVRATARGPDRARHPLRSERGANLAGDGRRRELPVAETTWGDRAARRAQVQAGSKGKGMILPSRSRLCSTFSALA
jgi:MFS family permease